MAFQEEDNTRAIFVPAPGMKVGRYTIVGELGAGGMGSVYLADDVSLKRQVALKFLSSELSKNDEYRTRFYREAQAAAALNHPNIVTIYEVSEHQGNVYIAMEYVRGKSLSDFIGDGRPELDRCIEFVAQICEGLGAAHGAGLVHRDIKPANILVDGDGRIRILDFGLARVEGDEKLTQVGTAMGTVNYMSPEQAQGLETDKRGDVFAVGVLMYELLTGVLPFKKTNMPATLHAIVHEKPAPINSLLPSVPPELSTIIERAMAKKPSERYASGKEMAEDLRRLLRGDRPNTSFAVTAARVEPLIRSLAVLHLRNLGPAEDEFLSYGITEDLIVDLTRVGSVRVVPMRSILKYKDSDAELEEIAEKLKVNLILDGSLHKAGESIRLSAQLVDVTSGQNLWAERWDQPSADLAKIKQALAAGVIQALNIGQSVVIAAQVGAPAANDPKAYENYLKGKYIFDHKKDTGDVDIALGLYRQALKEEPSLMAARAGIAEVLIHQGYYKEARESLQEGLREATEQQHRADQASMLRLLARVHMRQSDWSEARVAAQQALELTRALRDLAGEVETLGLLISILQSQARFDEALILFERVLEVSRKLDDQQKLAEALKNMGVAYARKGEFDRAYALYEEALETARTVDDLLLQAACYSNMGNVHYFHGQLDEAYAQYQQALDIFGRLGDNAGAARQNLNMGLIQLMRGNYSEGLDLLNKCAKTFERLGERSTLALTLVNISQIRLSLGEPDKAQAAAEKALELAGEIHHPLSECDALLRLGAVAFFRRDLDLAANFYDRAVEIAQVAGLTRNKAVSLLALAALHYYRGDFPACKQRAGEALAIAREIGEETIIALASAYLAALTSRESLYFAGVKQLQKLESEMTGRGDAQLTLQVTTILGDTLITQGRTDDDRLEGKRLLENALKVADEKQLAPEKKWLQEVLARFDTPSPNNPKAT